MFIPQQHNRARAVVLLLLLTLVILASTPVVTTKAQSGFKPVDAIFQEKCVACHNHTTRKGDLNLESYEALMAGGKRGVPVVPGKSGESLLVKMIEGSIKPRMPLGDELSAGEIKLIKAWIDAGASGANPAAAKSETTIVEPAANSARALPDIKAAASTKAAVSAIAFSSDNSLIAVGRYLEVELLNARDGKPIANLTGHANQVRSVAFSPNHQLLAAAGGNPAQFGEVKIWDLATKKELRTIRGHRDNIFAVAFSPDGNLLATCSYDKMIKLWDVATGNEVKNLKDHTDAVFAVAFSPTNSSGKQMLASASADRTVKIWDVATGARLYTLGDSLDAVNTIAFHPSGKLLAGAGADRIIRIWDIGSAEGRQVKSLIAHEDGINVLAFSPDGKTLASTGADKLLKLWDAATLEERQTLEKQPDWIFSLSFSPDGKRLAVGRYDGSIGFYDSLTGKRLN